MVIFIQYKFDEIPFTDYIVIAEDGKPLLFRQSKSNSSALTDETQMELHVYNLIMVIYIHFKFTLSSY